MKLNNLAFVLVSVLSALALAGCVTNPITGKQQFSLLQGESGKSQLVTLAKQAVPSQFSSDYGESSDAQANAYVNQIGRKLVATLTPADTVFPDMPFNFHVVNAVYVNAYAFPDGTIAITRGMLAELENEAQLAAVLGHEIAHVNCGHTASAMSKSTVYDMLVSGTQGYLASQGSSWADLAGTAGQLGSAVVLASYSRAQEREADEGQRRGPAAGKDEPGEGRLAPQRGRRPQPKPDRRHSPPRTRPRTSPAHEAAPGARLRPEQGGPPLAPERRGHLVAVHGVRPRARQDAAGTDDRGPIDGLRVAGKELLEDRRRLLGRCAPQARLELVRRPREDAVAHRRIPLPQRPRREAGRSEESRREDDGEDDDPDRRAVGADHAVIVRESGPAGEAAARPRR